MSRLKTLCRPSRTRLRRRVLLYAHMEYWLPTTIKPKSLAGRQLPLNPGGLATRRAVKQLRVACVRLNRRNLLHLGRLRLKLLKRPKKERKFPTSIRLNKTRVAAIAPLSGLPAGRPFVLLGCHPRSRKRLTLFCFARKRRQLLRVEADVAAVACRVAGGVFFRFA